MGLLLTILKSEADHSIRHVTKIMTEMSDLSKNFIPLNESRYLSVYLCNYCRLVFSTIVSSPTSAECVLVCVMPLGQLIDISTLPFCGNPT